MQRQERRRISEIFQWGLCRIGGRGRSNCGCGNAQGKSSEDLKATRMAAREKPRVRVQEREKLRNGTCPNTPQNTRSYQPPDLSKTLNYNDPGSLGQKLLHIKLWHKHSRLAGLTTLVSF